MEGAKAIEKVNVILMVSLFILLFSALFLAFVMDLNDGTLDGFVYMFSIQPEYLMEPETWISGLSQSAWSCSAGMGMAITYSVYMRKDEDTTLNAATMCLANNSISIIAGLTVMMAVFAVVDDPLSAVGAGSSAITFLVLPEVFAQAPGGPVVQVVMVTVFFLAFSFAALTSMISTVELCVRNFVDHGVDRSQAVGFTSVAIFLFGLPSAALWIKMDTATGVAFPSSWRSKTISGATGLCSVACSSPTVSGNMAGADTDTGSLRMELRDSASGITWTMESPRSVMTSSTPVITIGG